MKLTSDNRFAVRAACCFFVFTLIMVIAFLRLYLINSDNELKETAENQSSASVDVYNYRGSILDRNLNMLVDDTSEKIAVIPCNEKSGALLSRLLNGSALKTAIKTINEGFPAVIRNYKITNDNLYEFTVPKRYSSDSLATQLIGYTDSSGHGICGIEKTMDKYLYSSGKISVKYSRWANGKVMANGKLETSDDGNDSYNVVLTLDKTIQKISETPLKDTTGAVVIMNSESGEILSMSSAPTYDRTNISEYIDSDDKPFINRALNTYSVGSVFKLCVAAAALENGYTIDKSFTCNGGIQIGNRYFKCHEEKGHGTISMSTAVAESCNCYFYQLAIELGAKKILDMAEKCGFCESKDLGCSIISEKGKVPEIEKIKTDGDTANLAIGQGDLLLTPVNMLTLYSTIENGGVAQCPYILKYIEKNGVKNEYKPQKGKRIMSRKTADILKNILISDMDSGTASTAKPKNGIAGGKTATAQTGQYSNGVEIINGWLCGFFEDGSEKYTIIVMLDDEARSKGVCNTIFKSICDELYALNH